MPCGGADLRHLPIIVIFSVPVFISSKKCFRLFCLSSWVSSWVLLFLFAMFNCVSLLIVTFFSIWVILFVFIHYHRCYHFARGWFEFCYVSSSRWMLFLILSVISLALSQNGWMCLVFHYCNYVNVFSIYLEMIKKFVKNSFKDLEYSYGNTPRILPAILISSFKKLSRIFVSILSWILRIFLSISISSGILWGIFRFLQESLEEFL